MKKFNYKNTYYRCNNANELHHGLQYKTGYIIDHLPFNDNPTASCVPGGLYFTDIEHIGAFIKADGHIRPVKIKKEIKVILDPDNDKFRAHEFEMLDEISLKELFNRMPQSVGGYLDLRGCDLKGITLPQSVGGVIFT